LHWEEMEDPKTHPQRWTVVSVPERLARSGDPWRDIEKSAMSLGAARTRLDEAISEKR
jgi:bifunctional non-homologous end joining protein LigD